MQSNLETRSRTRQAPSRTALKAENEPAPTPILAHQGPVPPFRRHGEMLQVANQTLDGVSLDNSGIYAESV